MTTISCKALSAVTILLLTGTLRAEPFIACIHTEGLKLDPAVSAVRERRAPLVLMLDRLVEARSILSPLEPSLAEWWESDYGFTRWTFYLAHDVYFASGAEFGAKDVVFSLGRFFDPHHPLNQGFVSSKEQLKEIYPIVYHVKSMDYVQDIRIVDDLTVQFDLNVPDEHFPRVLSIEFSSIISKDDTEDELDAFGLSADDPIDLLDFDNEASPLGEWAICFRAVGR